VRRSRPILHKLVRSIKLRVIHIQDSPHRIALGVGIGFFTAFSPALGFHLILALLMSFIFRANKFAALLSIWVNNPLTFVPILYIGYLAGSVVTSLFGVHVTGEADFKTLLANFQSSSEFTSFYHPDFWKQLFDFFLRVGVELWIGCTILGVVLGCCGYILTSRVICWYRRKYPRRRYMAWQ